MWQCYYEEKIIIKKIVKNSHLTPRKKKRKK